MASAALATVSGAVSQALGTAASVTHLGDLAPLVDRIPVTLLLVGHCLACAGASRGRYTSPLLGYLQGFLMAFGGGIASSIFLGVPTSNVVFASNDAVLIWTAAWWLVNHNPLALVAQGMDLAPVGILARASLQIMRAGMVVKQLDLATKLFPGVVAPAVIAGVLAGSGGAIASSFVANALGFRAPFELTTPSYVLRSASVASVVYYATVHALGALSPAQGRSLVLLAFLLHTLADDVLGATYDYTEPVLEVFYTVTLMGGAPKARRGRPAATTTAAPTTPRSASKGRTTRRKAA